VDFGVLGLLVAVVEGWLWDGCVSPVVLVGVGVGVFILCIVGGEEGYGCGGGASCDVCWTSC